MRLRRTVDIDGSFYQQVEVRSVVHWGPACLRHGSGFGISSQTCRGVQHGGAVDRPGAWQMYSDGNMDLRPNVILAQVSCSFVRFFTLFT